MFSFIERIIPERPFDRKTKIIIVAAAVLLVIIIGVLIMRGMSSDNNGSGGKDTPYPYKYEIQKDGTMLLTIKAKEGCSWISAEDSYSLFSVEAATDEVKSGKTGLFIKAVQEGAQNLELHLVADGAADDNLATYVLLVCVTGNRIESITQIDFYEKAPNIRIEGTADAKAYYRENRDGSVSVFVKADYEADVVTEGAIALCDEGTRQGKYRDFTLTGTTGEGNVTVYFRKSATEDLVLNIVADVTEDGSMSVKSASFDTVEAVYELDEASKEARTQAKELFGKNLGIPKGATQISYTLSNWYDTSEQKVATVDVSYDGKYWKYFISNQLTTAELSGDIPSFATETKTEVINGISVTAMAFKDGVMMVWQDASGRACALTGDQMSADEALQTAKKFL